MKNDFAVSLGAFIGGLVGLIFAVVFIFCILGFPFMWMWNYTMPHVTGGVMKEINVYQAVCMLFISRLLFINSVGNYKK